MSEEDAISSINKTLLTVAFFIAKGLPDYKDIDDDEIMKIVIHVNDKYQKKDWD